MNEQLLNRASIRRILGKDFEAHSFRVEKVIKEAELVSLKFNGFNSFMEHLYKTATDKGMEILSYEERMGMVEYSYKFTNKIDFDLCIAAQIGKIVDGYISDIKFSKL